jgi:hypothetical protein
VGTLIAQMLIHDSSPFAWLVVVAYLAGAIACGWAARLTLLDRDRRFWAGTAMLLVLLGLNKQLDLQTLLTHVGRWMAEQEGWYGSRRLVQAAFLVALAAAAFLSLGALSAWLRRSAILVKLAAFGIVLLFGFILLRAASFHHMDLWVTQNDGGIRRGWWLELAGILIIAGSALIHGGRRGTLDQPADYAPEAEDGAQG